MKEKGFFDESPGNKSQTRLMSFTSLIIAAGIAALIMLRGDPSGNGMFLVYAFLSGAFAPKLIQKFAETKIKQ